MKELCLSVLGLDWQSWLFVDWEKCFCSAILYSLVSGLVDLEEFLYRWYLPYVRGSYGLVLQKDCS
jgi:hypothetical protein